MAFIPRTIDTIFQELLLEKQSFTSLNGLVTDITNVTELIQSLSLGSSPEWVLWLYNMAVQIHLTELRTGSAITDIQTIFDNKFVATSEWYVSRTLEFQYGDSVIVDPITYQVSYNPINVANQIIGAANVREVGNKLFIKIRKKDNTLLTNDELTSLSSYLMKVKIAGTLVVVENFEADPLTLNMTILYDGKQNLVNFQSQVEDIINDYIANLGFDSKFITNTLVDRLQALNGMVDPRFYTGIGITATGMPLYFNFEYTSVAGWCTINPLTPLSTTITYIPK